MTQHMDITRAEVLKQLSLINHFQFMQFKYHIQELLAGQLQCSPSAPKENFSTAFTQENTLAYILLSE